MVNKKAVSRVSQEVQNECSPRMSLSLPRSRRTTHKFTTSRRRCVCTPRDGPSDARESPGAKIKQDIPGMTAPLHPKHKLKVGNWNVRKLYRQHRKGRKSNKKERYRHHITNISETHWTGYKEKRNLQKEEPLFTPGETRAATDRE